MGTRATTIFQNNTDGIGLYTRWDGFPDEIKKQIINSEKIWENSFIEIRNKLELLPHDHPSQRLSSWIDSYENLKKLPDSIEKQSCLLAGQSFNHHHVTNDSTDGWDVVAQKNEKFSFKRKKALDFNNSNLLGIDIPNEYSLIKVSESLDDEDNQQVSYFKIKNFSRINFLKMMSSMPHFWTQFLMLDQFKDLKYSKDNFIHSWRRTLTSFMATRYDREAKCLNDTQDYFNDTIDNASSMIPFDFYDRKLYLHLFMQYPDQVLPLTFAEEKFVKSLSEVDLKKKVVVEVDVLQIMRLTAFGIKFNSENPISFKEFDDTMNHYTQEKETIAKYLGGEAIFSIPELQDRFNEKSYKIPELYLVNKKNQTMFIHYEVALLQNLYWLEKNLLKNKL